MFQGIPPHIDTHSCCDGQISSLSLGSDVVMNFSDGGGEVGSGESYSVLLPRRSLMVMSGRARYALRHSIVTRYALQWTRAKKVRITDTHHIRKG